MKMRSLWDEIIVDNFAGGGGASTGIEAAIGDAERIKLLEELLCSSRYVDNEGAVSCLGEILDCPDKDCGQCVHGKITDTIEEILGRER